MTKEKAIRALKWFKEYNEEDYCGGDRIQDEHGDWFYRITEQDFEAFEVAIKALEQETKNDNQILEDVKSEILEQFWGDSRKEYFDDKDSEEYKDGALEAADYIIKMIDKHNRQ